MLDLHQRTESWKQNKHTNEKTTSGPIVIYSIALFIMHRWLVFSAKWAIYTNVKSWITNRCEEMSDDINKSRFIIIRSLNGTDITLDIIIKFLLFIFLELLKSTSVLSLNFLLIFLLNSSISLTPCYLFLTIFFVL